MDDVSGSGASHPSQRNISPASASFVPDPIAGWICPHCMTTPYHLRATGSFSCLPPSPEFVDQHFAVCSGLTHQNNFGWKANEGRQSNLHQVDVRSLPHHIEPASSGPWEHSPTLGPHEARYETLFPGAMSPNVQSWQGYPSSMVQLPPSLSASKFHLAFQQPQPYYYNPQPPTTKTSRITTSIAEGMAPSSVVKSADNAHAAVAFLSASNLTRTTSPLVEVDPLVLFEDRHIITDYLYFLIQQLRRCRFKESDRKTRGGRREKIKLGYGGLECCHCAEGPGARKFFWTNVDYLANSFSEISGHIMSCANCPYQIKAALETLKLRHPEQMARRPRGSQRVFFRRVWRRLHPSNEDGEVNVSYSPDATSSGRAQIDEENPQLAYHYSTLNEKERAAPGEGKSSHRLPLAIESDNRWLSDMDCSIRRSLEVFGASAADVAAREVAGTYPIKKNQVGLRCIYCASTTDGAIGSAVMYPFSINVIYEKVREFYRLHLNQCPNLPPKERIKLSRQDNLAKSLSSISRRYYLVAAKLLGMYDTVQGICLQTCTSGQSTAPTFLSEAQLRAQHHPKGGETVLAAHMGNIAESSHREPHENGTEESVSGQGSDSRKRRALPLSRKTDTGGPATKKPSTNSGTHLQS